MLRGHYSCAAHSLSSRHIPDLSCSERSLLIRALNSSPQHIRASCSRHMQPTCTQGPWLPGGLPAVPWPGEAGWGSRSLGTQPCSPSPAPLPWGSIRVSPKASQEAGALLKPAHWGQEQHGLSSPDARSPRPMFHLLGAKAKGGVFPGSQGKPT